MTEIVTEKGKLHLATVIDLFSRRLLGYRSPHVPARRCRPVAAGTDTNAPDGSHAVASVSAATIRSRREHAVDHEGRKRVRCGGQLLR